MKTNGLFATSTPLKKMVGQLRPACTRLLPLLLVLALPAAVPAQFNYATNDGTIVITGYTGPGGDVIIPDRVGDLPVSSIGKSAFRDCTNRTSVLIPNSVTNIGNTAFRGCTSLANVLIPHSVTKIGGLVFSGCTSLTTITVDTNNLFYASMDGVLFNKSQTTLIQYPGAKAGSYAPSNSVTNIGFSAFEGCTSLTSITIPNSVVHVGMFAFRSCPSLTNVTISKSVTNIDFAFLSCTSLTTITVDALNSIYSCVDGVLFSKSQTTLIQCPGGKAGSYTVPQSVTSIAVFAFYGCTSLTRVTLPNSVTNIDNFAFRSCTSLTSVTIPDSVTSIGDWAFWKCASLRGVYFKGNAPSIDSSVFTGDTNATIYYLPGTTGWETTFGGRPTKPWNP